MWLGEGGGLNEILEVCLLNVIVEVNLVVFYLVSVFFVEFVVFFVGELGFLVIYIICVGNRYRYLLFI